MIRGLFAMGYLRENKINSTNDKLCSVLENNFPHTELGRALFESGLLTTRKANINRKRQDFAKQLRLLKL